MRFFAQDNAHKGSEFQLSAGYACYLGGTAVALTYWPLYFKSIGLVGAQIGLLFSVRTAMNVVLQPAISAGSDAVGRPLLMLRIAYLWAMVIPAGILFAQGFWGIAAAMWLAAILTGSVTPLLDASIVRQVGAQRFGDVRLWGSVGYGVMVLCYGLAMQNQSGATTGYGAIIAWVVLLGVGALAVLTLSRKQEIANLAKPRPKLGRAWLSAPLIVLFLINALHWWGITSFNIYIGLFEIAKGYSSAVVGMTAAAAIVGEVLAFALARRLVPGHLAHWMFPLVFVTGAVRWLVTAFAGSAALLIGIQLLHFLSFGVWIAALIHMIGRFVPDTQRTAAQGLMSGLTHGVGGMLGSLVSGFMFDIGGGALVFKIAAGVDVLACILFVLTWTLWANSARGEAISPSVAAG